MPVTEEKKFFNWSSMRDVIYLVIIIGGLLLTYSQKESRLTIMESRLEQVEKTEQCLDAADKAISTREAQRGDDLNEIKLNLKMLMQKSGLKYQTINGN